MIRPSAIIVVMLALPVLSTAGCTFRRDLAPGVTLTTATALAMGYKHTIKTVATPVSAGETVTFSWSETPAGWYRVRVMWHEDGAKEHRGPGGSITRGDLGDGCLFAMDLRDQTGAPLLVPEEGPPYGADRSFPPRARLTPDMDLTLTIQISPDCPIDGLTIWALLQRAPPPPDPTSTPAAMAW